MYSYSRCVYQGYAVFLFVWQFTLPLLFFCVAYWKILVVIRRQAKVVADHHKITVGPKEPVAGTSKGKSELATNTGLTSDKSGKEKGINEEKMTAKSTSKQAGNENKRMSKAKMNVIRTMIYINACFVICWMPTNVVALYLKLTVRSTNWR